MSDIIDLNLHPSGFINGAEAPLEAAGPVAYHEHSDDTAMSPWPSYPDTPDTPHSHDYEPCLGGQSHGQAAPTYSCGCYRRTKVESAPADVLVSEEQKLGLEWVH
jgi:hypothetical protein